MTFRRGFLPPPLVRRSRGTQAAAAAVVVGLAAVAGVGAAAAVAAPAEAVVERELLSMGTRLRVAVGAADRATATRAAEAAVRALEATEARLSTWRDDSELALLNATPVGAPRALSPQLARELGAALRCSEATSGAFDPGVGALVQLWGLRGAGRIPAAEEIAAALPGSRAGALELHGASAVRREAGLRLDEGGFGKGAGLDHALAAAAAAGARRAWLDLGGQTAVLGEGSWELAVAHPDGRDRAAVALTVGPGSVSTSGNGERGLVVGGQSVGHLLDPRTGAPAPDFGTLTVWAADALTADCLSTGLFVLGPDAALAWAVRHPEVGVLVLERRRDGVRARASASLAGRVQPLDPAVAVSFGVDASFGGEPAAVAGGENERSSGPSR